MAPQDRDEFYVGYVDRAPSGLARRMRAIVVGLAVVVPALLALLASGQNEQPSGRFEFGIYRDFEGVLYTSPLPYLRMTAQDGGPGQPAGTGLSLVAFGKKGIPAELRQHDGQRVRFRGSLIYRENLTMVEFNDPDSLQVLGPPEPGAQRGRHEVVGEVELNGELVDTKCYLGVMRPATGKVHRACAVRCLKGGIPPAVLVRDDTGAATVFMLVGTAGQPLAYDLEMAGREVRVQGWLELHDGVPVLRVGRMQPGDGS